MEMEYACQEAVCTWINGTARLLNTKGSRERHAPSAYAAPAGGARGTRTRDVQHYIINECLTAVILSALLDKIQKSQM